MKERKGWEDSKFEPTKQAGKKVSYKRKRGPIKWVEDILEKRRKTEAKKERSNTEKFKERRVTNAGGTSISSGLNVMHCPQREKKA